MTDSRFGHGLVIGKFYPPHAGHHLLVDAAAERCDRVTVVVLGGSEESIPTQVRVVWLASVHAGHEHVAVVGEDNDNPVDFDDPVVWALHVAVIEAALARSTLAEGRPPQQAAVDAVFSSEAYGPELGRRFGAEAVAVDVSRQAQPISGTAVRADVAGNWRFLAPAVRADLALRVAVLEAERAGGLAGAVVEALRARGAVWADTQVVSAQQAPSEQRVAEDAAAASGSPVLVCDNPVLATERPYDLCLTAGASPVPVTGDLFATGLRWQQLAGPYDEQVGTAVQAIDDLVATSWRFVEPRR